MFGHLTDFGRQRTPIEAIGFYLAYFISGIVIAGVIGAVAAPLTGTPGFEGGLLLGTIFALVACPVLAFAVLRAKGLLRHIGYLLVAVVSVGGAALGGLLLGLVFVAFLTTRPSATRSEVVEAGPSFA